MLKPSLISQIELYRREITILAEKLDSDVLTKEWLLWNVLKTSLKDCSIHLCLFFCSVYQTLWEKARVGCFKRTALKHVHYLGWNRSPAQVGCMSQVLRPGALGRPRGIGWRGRWEGGSEWGTHVNPWLFHFNVWQNPLQ